MKRPLLGLVLIVLAVLFLSGCNSIEFHNQVVTIDVKPDLTGTVNVAITISEYDLAYLADYQGYSDPVEGLAGLVADSLGWNTFDYAESTTDDGLRIVAVETSFDNPSHLNTLLSEMGTTDGLQAFTTPYGDVYTFAIALYPQQVNSARASFIIRLPGTVNQSSGTDMGDGFYSWNSTSGFQAITIATSSLPRFEAKYDIHFKQDGSGDLDVSVGADAADMQSAIAFYGSTDTLGARIAEGHGLSDFSVTTTDSGSDQWLTVKGNFSSSAALYEIMVDEAEVFETLNFFADSSFLTTDYTISGELKGDVGVIGFPRGTTVNISTPGSVESTTGAASSDNTVTWSSGDTSKTISLTASSLNMTPFIVAGVCALLGLGVVVMAVAGGGALFLRSRRKPKEIAPAPAPMVVETAPPPPAPAPEPVPVGEPVIEAITEPPPAADLSKN